MIRTVSFITALIITLALTLATWLIPEPVEDSELDVESGQPKLESNTQLAISQALDQSMLEDIDQPQQFLVVPVAHTNEKKEIVIAKEKKIKPSIPLPQYLETLPPPSLIYTGQMIDASGVKKVFLTFEEQTLVLARGDIVSQRWKIESIQENQITIFDQISNQLFVLNI